MRSRVLIPLLGLASLSLASASLAQSPKDPVGEALKTRTAQTQSTAHDSRINPQDEVAQTQALNTAIVEHNQAADAEDRANAQAHAAAMARFESQSAQARSDQAAYENQIRLNADSYAQAQAQHEQAMADWRATVAACKAGNTARCHAGQTTPY